MTGIPQSANSYQRKTLAWVFGVLAVYWLALIHQLGAQWSVYEQYNYGWAVPFLCLFLMWRRVRTGDGRWQTADKGKKSMQPNFQLPWSIFYVLLTACALLYAPTRLLHEANPIWRLTSLLWTIEVIVITLCLLRLSLHASRFTNFVFPICFFLVAVPWPSGIESFLVQTFTRLNVSATTELLGWCGIPALQHGNVIEVATGNVGIDEACSGIRSFQATMMIALFFGEIYRLNALRRVGCVLAGFALSFLFNMARTTLLTWVAAKKGTAAIAAWHDPAGVTILVGCFVTLWLVSVWQRKKQKAERRDEDAGQLNVKISADAPAFAPSTLNPSPRQNDGSTAWKAAIVLLAWFVAVEAGTQLWFGFHENSAVAREQWSVNSDDGKLQLTKVEIPADVRAQFLADKDVELRWRDEPGNFWQLYYFRWLPAHSLKQRVAIQLAKTHGPEKCLPAVGMTLKSDPGVLIVPIDNREFAFRQYVFLADDQPLYVFYAIYEDQTGTAILANRRQDTAKRIEAALAGSRNDGQRFLEMAVTGPQNSDQARVALRTELEKLIVTKP